MDSPNTSIGGNLNQQTPQRFGEVVEQAIIRLEIEKVEFENIFGFKAQVNYHLDFTAFLNAFRFLVGLTSALQEVNQDDPIVKEVKECLRLKSFVKMDGAELQAYALQSLDLSYKYLEYLGSKGVVSSKR